MEKIVRSPGDNPDHPYIIKAAFTGTAAANINGQTLHSTFSFSFGNEFFSLSDKARDEKRNQLENLLIVIIDEFSFIKADMLYLLDLRLREVKQVPDVAFFCKAASAACACFNSSGTSMQSLRSSSRITAKASNSGFFLVSACRYHNIIAAHGSKG